MNRVGVSIVNYGTARMAITAVRSLLAQPSGHNIDIHIVDNASPDGDPQLLESELKSRGLSDRVTCTLLDENIGFGAANNFVWRQFALGSEAPEYILCINPDAAVLTDVADCLSKFMDARPQIAFAGPVLRLPLCGTRRHAAFRFPHLGSIFQRAVNAHWFYQTFPNWRMGLDSGSTPQRVDWLSGACVMARMSALKELNGFDERFFLYWEEVELMRRAADLGWEAWHVPYAEVSHIEGGASGQRSGEGRIDHLPAYYTSWRLYFQITHGRVYAMTAAMLWLVGSCLYLARCRIKRENPKGAPRNIIRHITMEVILPLVRLK